MHTGESKDLLRTTTLILFRERDSQDVGYGTGFFVKEEDGRLFLVTNKHCVYDEDTKQPVQELSIVLSADDGSTLQIDIDRINERFFWLNDGTDLAIADVGDVIDRVREEKKCGCDYAALFREAMISPSGIEKMAAIEDVIMIGYPTGLRDTANNKPIVRRGITATDYALDYQGKPWFLADIDMHEGSSGSPVFLQRVETMSKIGEGEYEAGYFVSYFLIGIAFGLVVSDEQVHVDIDGKEYLSSFKRRSGLAYVIKVRKLIELLDSAKGRSLAKNG